MAVSLETALRLKAAGFPQPDLAPGQFWYGETEYKGGKLEHVPLCVVVEKYKTRGLALRRLTCEHLTAEYGGKPQVFAPGVADILKQPSMLDTWICGDEFWSFEQTSSENPVEACALAWLEINEAND